MRIELHHSFFSPVRSGMERRLHCLAEEYRKLNLDVTVLTSQEGIDDPTSFERSGIRISAHPSCFGKKPWSVLDSLLYSKRLLPFLRDKPSPDLVISMHYAYVVAARKAWTKTPIFYLPGGTLWDWTHDQNGFQPVPRRWLVLAVKQPISLFAERDALSSATETLVESEYLKNRYRSLYRKTSGIELLPVPVDTIKFRPDYERRSLTRKELGIADNEFMILALGRLDGRKNYSTIIRAVARLKSKWVLLISGVGPDLEQLKSSASGLPVRFLGLRADPECLFNAADVYVQPSFYESYSNTVQEATASGVASIISASINRGMTDGEHVLLADPNDVQSWTEKIEHVLRDASLRERLAKGARAFAESRPSWAELAKWLLNRAKLDMPASKT